MRDLTYFISDLHLGAGYIPDHREHERLVTNFLRQIAPRCRRLYLLGDILDYWWEYRDVVPRGFTRFLGTLADMADQGIEITWLKGNHDVWIFDYLPHEIGLTVHDGLLVTELDGRRFVMEHGDGVGQLPRTFRALRALFRCRPAQRLFAAIHPRWTVGFAHSWSAHSRKTGGYVSSPRLTDGVIEFARQYNASRPHSEQADYFIFGHLHTMLDCSLSPSSHARVLVIGDWISHFSYAVWDGSELKLKSCRNSPDTPALSSSHEE